MKAMENNRLIVLAPYKSALPADILKPQLFDVRIYKSAEEAWSLAEKETISLFISTEKFISASPAGLISALYGLHENMVHLFFCTNMSSDELALVVNASSKIHLANINSPKDALMKVATDAMNSYLKEAEKTTLISELIEQNEKYEFMLRQSMLF